MTYFRRKVDETLDTWARESGRLPLIVKGPRQVGKTESVRHFAQGRYDVICSGSVLGVNYRRTESRSEQLSLAA